MNDDSTRDDSTRDDSTRDDSTRDDLARADSALNGPARGSVAEKVRTVLARGSAGTVEAGLLRRPVRSVRVRDDGAVALLVDVGGMSRGSGDAAVGVSAGASATVEIVDTVCTGRCRASAPRPSFALDGRAPERADGCDDDCAVTRGVVSVSGIVTASSVSRRRRLVTADGVETAGAEIATYQMSELQPLTITYLGPDGAYVVPRAELAAAAVDPVGVDEQTWLRRLGPNAGLAARLALRAGLQIAGTDPRIVGISRFGVDVSVPLAGSFGDVRRLVFAQVIADPDDVLRELAALAD